jgi:hypothetical protein
LYSNYKTKYRINIYNKTRYKANKVKTILKQKTRDHRIRQSKRSGDPGAPGNKPYLLNPQITLGHASWVLCLFNPFMQNEPNLNISATKIYLDLASWLRCLLQLFTRLRRLFVTFCKFQKLTHLTLCTTKTYITFHHKIHFTRGVYPPFVKREKMQNKPNFNPTDHMHQKTINQSRPWRIPQNNKLSIIDNQLKGPISPYHLFTSS